MSQRQGRYAVKVDANQGEITKALTEAGYTWVDTHALGHGFPDLMVQARNGALVLLEVKTADGRMTDDEKLFFTQWRGSPIYVVRTAGDALSVLRLCAEVEDYAA